MAARTTKPAAGRPRAPKRSVDRRTRLAYHEAGHGVLSAVLADMPRHVSIRAAEQTLGHARAFRSPRPTSHTQVLLAGFAAEHLLTGRRPRRLDREVGFAIVAHLAPGLADAFVGSEDQDGARAEPDDPTGYDALGHECRTCSASP